MCSEGRTSMVAISPMSMSSMSMVISTPMMRFMIVTHLFWYLFWNLECYNEHLSINCFVVSLRKKVCDITTIWFYLFWSLEWNFFAMFPCNIFANFFWNLFWHFDGNFMTILFGNIFAMFLLDLFWNIETVFLWHLEAMFFGNLKKFQFSFAVNIGIGEYFTFLGTSWQCLWGFL